MNKGMIAIGVLVVWIQDRHTDCSVRHSAKCLVGILSKGEEHSPHVSPRHTAWERGSSRFRMQELRSISCTTLRLRKPHEK